MRKISTGLANSRPLVMAALWLVIMTLWSQVARAQSPASPSRRVNVTHDAHQILDDIASTPDGRLFVLWDYRSIFAPNPAVGLRVREYLPDGTAKKPFAIYRDRDSCCFDAQLAVNGKGSLAVAFVGRWSGGFPVRRYGFPLGPTQLWVDSSAPFGQVPEGIVVDQDGGFVTVWRSIGQEPADSYNGVFGRRYDQKGLPIGSEFHVNTFRRGDQRLSSLAMLRSTGAFVVVWQSKDQDGSGWGIYGQRFAANGEKLGGELLVPTTLEGDQEEPEVAMDLKGNFVVTWRGTDPADLSRSAIFAQRFGLGGERLGGEIRVSDAVDGYEDYPRVSLDPHGNFVISWDHWLSGLVYARLYRANGTPVRPAVQLTPVSGQLAAKVAFADNGTFAAGWTDFLPGDDIEDVYTQRFSASPGTEFCLFRHGELVCDTGRTGGTAEVRYPFGGEAGETGLLGDLDGDGRADSCVYRAGVFRCDTAHDFGSRTRIRFGQSGDVPLLGDVDGDGKADPCVYRVGRFLCDTAHDGAAAEVEVAFGGPAGDVPLLGDVDGDGKADPCVFRRGVFLCDTADDGNAGLTIAFGQAGDVPLLGDFNGDGRADPCVYRAGQLRCDTAHDGGAAEGMLTFGAGDGVPLLGNLDGL